MVTAGSHSRLPPLIQRASDILRRLSGAKGAVLPPYRHVPSGGYRRA